MNQKQRILKLLNDGNWHSTIELQKICWRYSARLWDLREDGYVFDKRPATGYEGQIEEWKLVDVVPNNKSQEFGEVITANN